MQNKFFSKFGGFMKSNKKKIIVLVAMIALLVGTGCLNYFLNVKGQTDATPNNQSEQTDNTTVPSFFETYREDREATRNQEITYLDEIIADATSTAEAVSTAEIQRQDVCSRMEKELIIEGLVKANGFEDCIVTISSENVNVVVKDEELTLEESTQILNVIVSETDFKAKDVVIIPYV